MRLEAMVSTSEAARSEREFYALYDWCLNPILPVRELFDRLREELDRFERLEASWQRQESLINLYLFVCAVACGVDDSLARAPWQLSSIATRFPTLRLAVTGLERCLNAPDRLRRRLADRAVVRWRRSWNRSVDRGSSLLLAGLPSAAARWAELRTELEALMDVPLPVKPLREKMRLPEAFRCQDFAHQDVITLARKLGETLPDREAPVVIVGVRTAGAYFAPLVAAVLVAGGWARVSWITIRPKLGLSRWEARQLRRLRHGGARVVLVDDYQNTGLTARLGLGLLGQHGVRPDRVTLVVPRHPAKPGWALPAGAPWADGVTLVTLEPAELHKASLLEPSSMEPRLREYLGGTEDVQIQDDNGVKAINARFSRRAGDGFQVRLKRVFEVRSGAADDHGTRVLAKSAGWGWLGYHAYLMAARLSRRVPPLIGLRDGFLLTKWLDGESAFGSGTAHSALVDAVALYTARRVQRLPLTGDPCFDAPEYKWTGWHELVSILRGAYGPYIGRLKTPALRRRLRPLVSPVPTAVDGRMRAEDWIETPVGIFKTDFEHHSFGGAELDVVDPAYDLAGAMCELALPEAAAHRLLEIYARESGDRAVTDRLLLYELLYGVVTMRRAARDAASEQSAEGRRESNRRRLRARRFLISRMIRFQAGLYGSPPPRWSKRLFFLDLDGVFDCEALGFPHTTPSGLDALRLLREHDFSVVLNTGRGLEDVRDYCRVYGLPGGLAEFGSVFVDAVADRELTLIGAEAGAEIARCRETLETETDVCLDPGYRHSIHAYRYRDGRTVGLEAAEVAELLERTRGERLEAILRPEDTYIVQKGTGKAHGVRAVRLYLGCEDEPVAAIGDSRHDVDLLEEAELAYAPSNCARSVRAVARRGGCRVMRQPYQRGLLAAVTELVGETRRRRPGDGPVETGGAGEGGRFVRLLLEAAERSTVRQWLGALSWRTL